VNHHNSTVVNARCPICNHNGALHGIPNVNDAYWIYDYKAGDGKVRQERFVAGIRQCPNLECRAVLFSLLSGDKLRRLYPPETLDFDATNLPPNIQETLEEGIRCYSAECYKATALMVRRVLEELCEAQSAAGKDLKERLSALAKTIVVPRELIDAATELRLLGNDAAHVNAKDYDSIGREEAELAIGLAKELLKATYQYASLLARLKSFKTAAASPSGK
jgi:Domain of unknown function (DUF4145)